MDEGLESQDVLEETELYKPKMIFDGKCEHEYVQLNDDPEGNGRCRCAKCPMGKMFDKQSYIIENGGLVERRK